jgi:hypothetical protein
MAPFHLNDEEMAAAADIAASVPILARDAFLSALAKALEHKVPPYGPATVNRAARVIAAELLAVPWRKPAQSPVIDGRA